MAKNFDFDFFLDEIKDEDDESDKEKKAAEKKKKEREKLLKNKIDKKNVNVNDKSEFSFQKLLDKNKEDEKRRKEAKQEQILKNQKDKETLNLINESNNNKHRSSSKKNKFKKFKKKKHLNILLTFDKLFNKKKISKIFIKPLSFDKLLLHKKVSAKKKIVIDTKKLYSNDVFIKKDDPYLNKINKLEKEKKLKKLRKEVTGDRTSEMLNSDFTISKDKKGYDVLLEKFVNPDMDKTPSKVSGIKKRANEIDITKKPEQKQSNKSIILERISNLTTVKEDRSNLAKSRVDDTLKYLDESSVKIESIKQKREFVKKNVFYGITVPEFSQVKKIVSLVKYTDRKVSKFIKKSSNYRFGNFIYNLFPHAREEAITLKILTLIILVVVIGVIVYFGIIINALPKKAKPKELTQNRTFFGILQADVTWPNKIVDQPHLYFTIQWSYYNDATKKVVNISLNKELVNYGSLNINKFVVDTNFPIFVSVNVVFPAFATNDSWVSDPMTVTDVPKTSGLYAKTSLGYNYYVSDVDTLYISDKIVQIYKTDSAPYYSTNLYRKYGFNYNKLSYVSKGKDIKITKKQSSSK